MNKIDIVKAVKNQQKTFTPQNFSCPDEPCFQKIAEAIIETESQGYITGVLLQKSNKDPMIESVLVTDVTQLGEELLEMEEAKGSIY